MAIKVEALQAKIEALEEKERKQAEEMARIRRSTVGEVVELMMPDGGITILSSDTAEGPRKPDSLLQACSDVVLKVDSEGARIVMSARAIRWPSGDSDHLVELLHMVMCENTSDRMG